MKTRLISLFLLFCSICCSAVASSYEYGLYFKSHSVAAPDRTTLYLDDSRPFPVKKEFVVRFGLLVRGLEPEFGSIVHFSTDTGQTIRFSLVSNNHQYGPALVSTEGLTPIDVEVEHDVWVEVSVRLLPAENSVEVRYDGQQTLVSIPLQGTSQVSVQFGAMESYLADVAPVNVRDIRVDADGKRLREWKLMRHDGERCYDECCGGIARAKNPYWLLDSHIEWREIFRKTFSESTDVAFDTREALFYMVHEHRIGILDRQGKPRGEIPVEGGFRAIDFPGFLLYDSLSNRLVSYFPGGRSVSYFSFDTRRWTSLRHNAEEPSHYNHARAFNPADSTCYIFGGYGFYQYRNDLFRLRAGADTLEPVDYAPLLDPRFGAAAAVVGDELYLFGGRGNAYGKQELASHNYGGLYAINFRTGASRTLWEISGFTSNSIMASSMCFHPADSAFYAVTMNKGGELWRIPMTDSLITAVSKPIGNDRIYQDGDFSLYAAPGCNKLFLVLNKILSDRTHDIGIYSIDLPLMEDADILQVSESYRPASPVRWVVIAVLVLLLFGWLLFRRRRRGQAHEAPAGRPQPVAPAAPAAEPDPAAEEPLRTAATSYYDRSRSSILLLGSFRVFDRNGEEVTAHFTPRLKHLLIMLILYSEKYQQGILVSRMTELLWPGKESNAARNNRNVNLRKLRQLLESIGNAEIVIEHNCMRIEWGGEIFCDYHEVLSRIAAFEQQGESPELLDRILELLLYGPLLPNTIHEWLDDFKDAYSSSAIDLLNRLLAMARQKNQHDTTLCIADILFLHDPLNEEALAAKCAVLSAQGKAGIARNVYDRFCKEYQKALGEKYTTPFSEL